MRTGVGTLDQSAVTAAAVTLLGRHLAAGARRWLLAADPGPLQEALAGAPGATAPAGDLATLRAQLRGDDVVVVVLPPAEALDVCLRAQAWGVATLLLPLGGQDTVLPAGSADVALPPVAGPAQAAALLAGVAADLARCGVRPGPPPEPSRGTVCVTCADEGVVGEVEDVVDPVTARVRTPDGVVDVDTTLVGPLREHDLVLLHARSVLTRLEPPPVGATRPTTTTTGTTARGGTRP